MANRIWNQTTFLDSAGGTVSSSTDATPIVVTTAAAHGLKTGDRVWITGHTTNTNANGEFTITVASATTFSLDGSTATGGGAGSSGTYYYGVFKNGLCGLKVKRVRIRNSSGSAFTVEMWDGPTAEFSGGASTFSSTDAATNAAVLSGAGLEAVNGRNLDGRLFTNNSLTPHIIGKSNDRIFLSSVTGLSTSGAWSIDGTKWGEFYETANGTYHYDLDGLEVSGLWVKGAGSTVQVWIDWDCGSWAIPQKTAAGTVGNRIGAGTGRIKLA